MERSWIRIIIGISLVVYFFLSFLAMHRRLSILAPQKKITWNGVLTASVFAFAIMIFVNLTSGLPWELSLISAPLAIAIGLCIAFFYARKK
jgi:hypothetical protein